MKTILVDDEGRALSSLETILNKWCPEVEIIAKCQNAFDAQKKISTLMPQLVFLDIDMPGKSGFDLLREFPEPAFEVIFITAFNDFMMQAFRFSAIDYLLKPIDVSILRDAVRRASYRIRNHITNLPLHTLMSNIRSVDNKNQLKLCIHSTKGFDVVSLDEIIYCSSDSNYTNFYFTNRKSICSSKPLHDYEDLLKKQRFFRIHKSYLVNLDHIDRYVKGEGGILVMKNGTELEVSRRRKAHLLNQFKDSFKFF